MAVSVGMAVGEGGTAVGMGVCDGGGVWLGTVGTVKGVLVGAWVRASAWVRAGACDGAGGGVWLGGGVGEGGFVPVGRIVEVAVCLRPGLGELNTIGVAVGDGEALGLVAATSRVGEASAI